MAVLEYQIFYWVGSGILVAHSGGSCKTPSDSLHNHAAHMLTTHIGSGSLWGSGVIRRHLWRPATSVTNFTDEEANTLRVKIICYLLKDHITKGFELRVHILGTWVNLKSFSLQVSFYVEMRGLEEMILRRFLFLSVCKLWIYIMRVGI